MRSRAAYRESMRFFRRIAVIGIAITAGSVFVHLANLAWANVSPGRRTDSSIWHVVWFDAGLVVLAVGFVGWLVSSVVTRTNSSPSDPRFTAGVWRDYHDPYR